MEKTLTILLIALCFEAIGVVLLSRGLKQIGEVQRWTISEVARIVGRGVTNKHILLGVLFETIFFVGLLTLLANAEVSLIWPLTSLGFVITTLAARVLEREQVSPLRWSGVILIVIGAAIVGWSKKSPTPNLPAVPTEHARVGSPK